MSQCFCFSPIYILFLFWFCPLLLAIWSRSNHLGRSFFTAKKQKLVGLPFLQVFTSLLLQPLKFSKIHSTTITQFLLLVCVALCFTVQVFLHAGCNLQLTIMLGVLFKILSLFFFHELLVFLHAGCLTYLCTHLYILFIHSFSCMITAYLCHKNPTMPVCFLLWLPTPTSTRYYAANKSLHLVRKHVIVFCSFLSFSAQFLNNYGYLRLFLFFFVAFIPILASHAFLQSFINPW
jgi:hypothetical protein